MNRATSSDLALALMCPLLSVSVNGFRAWPQGGDPNRKQLTDAQLMALMRSILAEVKCAYGSPRMLDELRARGFRVGKARVERLMREHVILPWFHVHQIVGTFR